MEPVFEIIEPSGHKYAIYANGKIEGFPKGSTVFNRVLLLVDLLKGYLPSTKKDLIDDFIADYKP
jgi:hypothetical protein